MFYGKKISKQKKIIFNKFALWICHKKKKIGQCAIKHFLLREQILKFCFLLLTFKSKSLQIFLNESIIRLIENDRLLTGFLQSKNFLNAENNAK